MSNPLPKLHFVGESCCFMLTNDWLLRVKLNGEWEECRYSSAAEALHVFSALFEDYPGQMRQATLHPFRSRVEKAPSPQYIN